MRLQWSEIRARAAAFSERHKFARYEKGETHTFYNEFFDCFGVDRKQVAVYEQRVRNLPGDKQGFIDLFWPGTLIVEQKSAGLDLRKASEQALDYFDWVPEVQRPRYILTCDFQRWHLLDLEDGRRWDFQLHELKKHVEAFAFVLGVQPRIFRNQKAANPKASELLGKLHRSLEEQGYQGHQLQLLLVRLLFILFADDTGIWPKDQFLVFLERRTSPDGRDLGRWLNELFAVLDTPEDKRQSGLDADLAKFPHVNGALFRERIDPAVFDNAGRDILLDASIFNWGEVSPAIFGSLFESVIDKITRRKQGAHYTPEDAIQKLIGPLFLEEFWEEFERLRARKDGGRAKALQAFHDRLASLTFFDPACGAGNFLVVTYRELRELERELIKELHIIEGTAQLVTDITLLSKLNVDQFYGIEIDEFPSQIAQVALWMTDHIANTRLGEDFGKPYARIPLVTAPNIRQADALETEWSSVLPAEQCSYVLGNPPFGGSKYQSSKQRAQVRRVAKLSSGGTLDYVAAWFIKAAEYVQGGGARIAFVATNSICQGEQVGQLWPILFHRQRLEIAFAHRTFVWPGRAGVHCIIVGLAQSGDEPPEKRLFSYVDGKGKPIETRHRWLTAYLFDAQVSDRHLVVKSERHSINGAQKLTSGSQPIDDGNFIFLGGEKAAFLEEEPNAEAFLRPYIAGDDFLNGGQRWILALQDASPAQLRGMPLVRERIHRVRVFRAASNRKATLEAAGNPTGFGLTVIPDSTFLVIPKVSSERREYVPIAWVEPPSIPSDLVFVLPDASSWEFGMLTSTMHMAWLRHIGGRLESRYRYSIGLVYNTFPWPETTAEQRSKIEELARAVLDARALPKNANSSLADMYDPDLMPVELLRAHRALDNAVDRLYRAKAFDSDRERVEHLFRLYESLVQPTAAAAAANKRTVRRVARMKEAAE